MSQSISEMAVMIHLCSTGRSYGRGGRKKRVL